jgi:hypothetical protein
VGCSDSNQLTKVHKLLETQQSTLDNFQSQMVSSVRCIAGTLSGTEAQMSRAVDELTSTTVALLSV